MKYNLIKYRFTNGSEDEWRREVARLLSENAPPATVLARYGGDEFVAILPGTPLPRAVQTADNLRRVIAEATLFDVESEPGQPAQLLPGIRASIGVASYREHLAPGGNQRRRENLLFVHYDDLIADGRAPDGPMRTEREPERGGAGR